VFGGDGTGSYRGRPRANAFGSQLMPEIGQELRRSGFIVVPDVLDCDLLRQLTRAYDSAVAAATPPDLRVGSDTTRVHGLLNTADEFERLSVHAQVLEACRCVIGQPFRLSGLLARTVRPRSRTQALHVDVEADSDGWPMVGFIWMVDAFSADNGSTRFVPGSHEWSVAPATDSAHEVVARGSAGSLIIYNGSVWHGHSANRTNKARRSVQGAYIRAGPPG